MHGFSLIEILIAMAILTVGLLGAAKLQALVLHAHRDASHHMAAAELAGDLAEAMLVNPALAHAAALGGHGDSSAECHAGPCQPDVLAAAQWSSWQAALRLRLSAAHGVLCPHGKLAVSGAQWQCGDLGAPAPSLGIGWRVGTQAEHLRVFHLPAPFYFPA
ncbi:type IV pilus modification protein PilV [Pandoraea sp.]|uniref:type IV pilus modification protein PilV n=1 Tax=Pandoraea sp. TaxID=1883445 RepID=UPI00120BD02A|nr:type IV pilus modification protein PilV [Pandoraea sp.]TAL55643.1 MAG: type IV pilus modification protein PilV [Pandoraea sp.]TAM16812.1 MAG: type IV pilus modification protein PilV [Pandoraea sp.]